MASKETTKSAATGVDRMESDTKAGDTQEPQQRRCEKYNLRRSSLRLRVQTERRSQEPDEEEEEEEKPKRKAKGEGSRRGGGGGGGGGAASGGAGGGGGSKQKKAKARPPPLSKYRRRSANARERFRMAEINDAFEDLKVVLPQRGLETMMGSEGSGSEESIYSTSSSASGSSSSISSKGKGSSKSGGSRGAAKQQPTKITVLRLAINYIAALRDVLGYNPDGTVKDGDTDSPGMLNSFSSMMSLESLVNDSSLCGTVVSEEAASTHSDYVVQNPEFTLPKDSEISAEGLSCAGAVGGYDANISSTNISTTSGRSNPVQTNRNSTTKDSAPAAAASKAKAKTTRRRSSSARGSTRRKVIRTQDSVPANVVTGSTDTVLTNSTFTNTTCCSKDSVLTSVASCNRDGFLPCSNPAALVGSSSGFSCRGAGSSATAAAVNNRLVANSKDSILADLMKSSASDSFLLSCKDSILSSGGYTHRGDLHLPINFPPLCSDDLGSDAASTTTTTSPSTSSGDEESLISSPTSDMVVVDLDFFGANLSAADFSPELSPDFTATLSPEEEMCLELVASVL